MEIKTVFQRDYTFEVQEESFAHNQIMCLLNIVHLLSLMHSPNKDSELKIPLQ